MKRNEHDGGSGFKLEGEIPHHLRDRCLPRDADQGAGFQSQNPRRHSVGQLNE